MAKKRRRHLGWVDDEPRSILTLAEKILDRAATEDGKDHLHTRVAAETFHLAMSSALDVYAGRDLKSKKDQEAVVRQAVHAGVLDQNLGHDYAEIRSVLHGACFHRNRCYWHPKGGKKILLPELAGKVHRFVVKLEAGKKK